jgi:hypothetical protein
MQNQDINLAVKFLLDTLQVQFTDNTDYAAESITPSKVAGIITAKRANSVFHSTTNYDAPDISPGTSLVDTISGPGSKLPESIYNFKYSIRVFDEVVTAGASGSMTSSVNVSFASSDVSSQLNALITNSNQVAIAIYDSGANLLGIRNIAGNFSFGAGSISVQVQALSTYADADSFRIVTYYSKEYTFNFCNTLPDVCIEVFGDCLRAQISVSDKTIWPAGYNVSDHLIKLQYPRNKAGSAVASPVETDQYSLIVGPNIYTGGYTISVSANVLYTQEDGLVVEGAVEGFKYPNIQCDTSWCCLRECIDSIHEKYLQALRVGSKDMASLANQLFNISIYRMRYELAVECQDTVAASNILSALKEFMNTSGANCDCGCSGAGADGEPELITPLYSA